MRSTFAGLNTAVLGLQAQQVGLDTMGHNVTNVNTAGYSRQQVNLATTRSQTYGGLSSNIEIGSGVGINSIVRKRDNFLDHQYWKANSTLAYSNVMKDSLEKIEEIFQEPSDTGLSTVFNAFWNSLQTLSTNAADYGVRENVKSCGDNLVNAIQLAAKQLKDNISDLNDEIDLHIQTFNEMASEVSSLNKQIIKLEVNGDNANDLRDSRDLLIDKMSDYTKLEVSEDEYGAYIVRVNGNMLISRVSYTNLESRTSSDSDYGYEVRNIYFPGADQPLKFQDGEFKALLDARDSDSTGNKKYLNELSLLSQYFLTDFNEIHRAGLGADNSTGNNFFGSQKLINGQDYDYKNGDIIISPKTGQPEVSIPSLWTKGDWLDALTVNDVFNTTEGLGKIAAKTSLNSEIVSKVNAPVVTNSGTYSNTITDDVYAFIKEQANPDPANGSALAAADIDTAVYDASGKKAITASITVDSKGKYTVDYGGTATTTASYDAANKKLTFTVNGVTMTFNDIDQPEAYKYQLIANAGAGSIPTATLKSGAKQYVVVYTKDPTGQDTTQVVGSGTAIYSDGALGFNYMGLSVKSEIPDNCEVGDFNYKFSSSTPIKTTTYDNNGNQVEAGGQLTITTEGVYDGGSGDTPVVVTRDKNGDYKIEVGSGTDKQTFNYLKAEVPIDHKIELDLTDSYGVKLTIDVSKAETTGAGIVGTYEFVLTKNNNASGDNAINMANLMKKGEVALLGNQSLESHYAVFIADLSVTSQNMQRLAENQDSMVLQIDNWRQSVCGVSIDDEMTDMIRYQRGYGAASRVLTTMDEMLDKLINSTGTVGR